MAQGGIMTLEEPRQGYFLGRIVKKAKRAVKKITKSPLGKAADYSIGFGYGLGGAKFLGGSRYIYWRLQVYLVVLANLKNLFFTSGSKCYW